MTHAAPEVEFVEIPDAAIALSLVDRSVDDLLTMVLPALRILVDSSIEAEEFTDASVAKEKALRAVKELSEVSNRLININERQREFIDGLD